MDAVMASIRGAGAFVVPELILVGVASLLFLVAPFVSSPTGRIQPGEGGRWAWITLATLLLACAFWFFTGVRAAADPAASMFLADGLAHVAKGAGLLAAIVLVLMSWNQVERFTVEYYACLLLIFAGVHFVAAANDLVSLFLSLELISIPTYVLLYVSRNDLQGKEATIKYFLLSVFSSALFLYGASFLYGAVGSTNLTVIQQSIREQTGDHMPGMVLVALVLIVAGIGFRVTAVPFHFYAPDVFAGTSTGTAALLAYVPKLAGFVALVRLVSFVVPTSDATEAARVLSQHAASLLWVVALLTMTLGNLLALLQDNVKRLLAYSSVAHAGYMLVALAAGESIGVAAGGGATSGSQAILFYLVVYGAMTLGAFAVLQSLHRFGVPAELVEDFAGLGRSQPGTAFMMAVFLFSLTGLPPTAGFWGKLNIFFAAWTEGTPAFKALALAMALNAAVGAWYYLRIVGLMYLQPPAESVTKKREGAVLAGMVICAAVTLGLFVAPSILWRGLIHVGM